MWWRHNGATTWYAAPEQRSAASVCAREGSGGTDMRNGSADRGSSIRSRGQRTPVWLVVLGGLLLITASCTDDGSIEVVTDDSGFDAVALAEQNAFGNAAVDMMVPGSAMRLQVEYFEPVRKGTWTAPDHCWFSTRVSVDSLVSPGFNGPTSDADTAAGEGVLVGSTTSYRIPDMPAAEPSTNGPMAEPTTTARSADTSDDSAVATTVAPAPGSESDVIIDDNPNDDIAPSVPGEEIEPPTADEFVSVLVVVYGHDQVAELTSEAPGVLDEMARAVQPLDGWNLLEVGLDPTEAPTDVVPVSLRRVHADGAESTEHLEVHRDRDDLELLTPRWAFDMSAVDDSCEVPNGDADNTPLESPRDLLGAPVGDTPLLPDPGEQPADPTTASDLALASIRKVYDLGDIYSLDKKGYVENPDDYLIMREQLLANDVVAPYMSNLDPVFRSIVFTSPTDAAVLYQVGPTYQWEIGRVLLIDGTWRVAAGTVCRDLAAAGYFCPNAEPDPAPGPLG